MINYSNLKSISDVTRYNIHPDKGIICDSLLKIIITNLLKEEYPLTYEQENCLKSVLNRL